MKLSRASTYAFYGLSYLAGEDRLVPLSEIRRFYGVPEKQMAKIFRVLVDAGILSSVRGTRGGFALARSPDEITPLEVIEAIDGPFDTSCLLLGKRCSHEATCHIHAVWRRSQEAMVAVLRGTTLAQMIQGRRFRPPRAGNGLVALRRK